MRSHTKKQTYQFGILHEKEAVEILKSKNYKIVKTRYKNKYGEIDIIAKKENLTVFVEVKSRKKEELIEVILRPKQIKRIKNAAQLYIGENPEIINDNFRFDFILFFDDKGVEHYEDYF